MPRKKSDLPPAVRVRENQRRSRNRRKDLIAELQQRIQEYEQQEVQATALVQVAARKVVTQNTQLRQLLYSKGVFDQEIDEFLSQQQPQNQLPPQPQSQSRPIQWFHIPGHQANNTPQSGPDKPRAVLGAMSLLSRRSPETRPIHDPQRHRPELSQVDPHLEAVDRSKKDRMYLPDAPAHKNASLATSNYVLPVTTLDCGQTVAKAGITSHACSTQPETSLLSEDPDCFCPAAPEPQVTSSEKTGFEMSCEMAASIIVGMHGNSDLDQIRARLGCNEKQDCNVRNVDVMQVMETG